MDEINFPQLPFLTREMFKWGNKTPFGLRIAISAFSSNPIRINGLTRSGIIGQVLDTPATSEAATHDIGISDLPIWLGVTDESGSFQPGECWVSVTLLVNGVASIPLCSGYVSMFKGIAFPQTEQLNQWGNRGMFAEVDSTDPAANTEISVTVPAGELWLVHSIVASLQTDANVANRRAHFVFTLPGGHVIDTYSAIDHTASATWKYTVAKFGAINDNNDGNDALVPLPEDLWLYAESTITTETKSMQATDNWGAMSIFVEKFFIGV